MLRHHTNWPRAYRESVLLSSVVFWDVRAEVRKVEKWQKQGVSLLIMDELCDKLSVCVCVCVRPLRALMAVFCTPFF